MANYKNLTPEQRSVYRVILERARLKQAKPIEVKAAVETGLVESNLRNLPGGDADSAGWRQERRSLYRDPTNVAAAADRFFDEARALRGKYKRAGDLAAAVQRPAAQYRGRYQQRSAEADALLGRESASQAISDHSSAKTMNPPTEGVDRRKVLLSYLQNRGRPGALLEAASTLEAAPLSGAAESGQAASPEVQPAGVAESAARRASRIDSWKQPYLWGGGHGGKVRLNSGPQPLDCSGAVSAVLGIDPRVSGQFTSWGKPGEGKGPKTVTVYANDKHVLMRIGDRFFGTSASNPGGGAGWIPRSQISPEYLKGFVARHA